MIKLGPVVEFCQDRARNAIRPGARTALKNPRVQACVISSHPSESLRARCASAPISFSAMLPGLRSYPRSVSVPDRRVPRLVGCDFQENREQLQAACRLAATETIPSGDFWCDRCHKRAHSIYGGVSAERGFEGAHYYIVSDAASVRYQGLTIELYSARGATGSISLPREVLRRRTSWFSPRCTMK